MIDMPFINNRVEDVKLQLKQDICWCTHYWIHLTLSLYLDLCQKDFLNCNKYDKKYIYVQPFVYAEFTKQPNHVRDNLVLLFIQTLYPNCTRYIKTLKWS